MIKYGRLHKTNLRVYEIGKNYYPVTSDSITFSFDFIYVFSKLTPKFPIIIQSKDDLF